MVKRFPGGWSAKTGQDTVATLFDFISFVFTVGASLWLAVTAAAPDMRVIYPGFLVGAAAGTYAYYRRRLVWPMALTTYFIIINIVGFGRAVGWY